MQEADVTSETPAPLTGEVQLRDVSEDDLPILFEHQLQPAANRMAAFQGRDWEAFTAHWAKILADDSVLTRTILYKGQVAGNIGSYEHLGKREVGYWIGQEYWGKGVATRALAEFLGCEEQRPIYAHVAKQNIASRRVLEKCGFTICGEDQGLPGPGGEPVAEFVLVLQ